MIFSQAGVLFQDRASRVSLPGEEGEFEVMAFHAPIISLLLAGRILVDGRALSIQKGIAKMEGNALFIFVER